ncbi:MAG: TolB-like 6-bladed beta-propeller domain-containing protein [Prevotellaceae bacterium]|nr:TolB-like 6-bladed beta-propeller domain-containing protein [Prevotellaceae bacterium]
MTPYPFSFSPLSKKALYSDKEIMNLNLHDFIYAETTPVGKSIFRTTAADDSVYVKEIYNLGLDPKMKSGFSYIGDFVANVKQNRMAYAYKYFKIIKFMDLDAQTVRTVNFEKEEFDEGSMHIADGLDNNVTHYWGACAGERYVYFLYSGRSPVVLYRERQRQKEKYKPYIYVEQYDWNGNPVRKYKLDRWGYFTVDESNNKLYLLSTHDDDPLFVFQLLE